jgi:5-methylcytosine-specific restriction enzyme subunit McrC
MEAATALEDGGAAEAKPQPVFYDLEEYGTAQVPLSDLVDDDGQLRLNPDVEAKGYFTVQLVKGRVSLQAAGYVGLIPLNDRAVINVVPRVPVANLSRLLRVSRHMPDFLLSERGYERDEEWNESLLDLYARTMVERVETIASSGLLREYRREESDTSFPRGRILFGPTFTRLRPKGITHKVTASRFERTADHPANRCLKYAIWFLADRLRRLGRSGRGRRELLLRLGTLYELFGEVPLDHSLAFLHDPQVRGARSLPSLRQYYRPALDIAVAIVLEHAIKLEGQKTAVELPSLVLNMSTVFEGYLRTTLRQHALDGAWDVEVLDGNTEGKKLLFDSPPSEDATPDIVLRSRDDGSYPVIIEVKNIPALGNSSRTAIEQAITYAVTFRCDRLVLAHPRGHGQTFSGLRLQGRIGQLALYQYVFDLASDSLDIEDARFSRATADLVNVPR